MQSHHIPGPADAANHRAAHAASPTAPTPAAHAPTTPPVRPEPAPSPAAASPRGMAAGVLAFCFVMGLLARALPDCFAVYVVPLTREFGWERADIVSIYAVYALASAVAGPLTGRLFDRSGPRTVYLGGIALLGGSFTLAGFAGSLWQLQATIGLGVGIAATCLGNVANTSLLSRWYGARLVFATSVVFSGYGLGTFTLVPLSQLLVDRYQWRGAYLRCGLGILALLLPLLLLPWRRIRAGAPGVGRPTATAAAFGGGLTLPTAMRHNAFWGLFATLFFTSLGMYAFLVEVLAYLRDTGFDPLFAATAWGFSGALLPVGMLGVSALDGIIGRRRCVLLTYLVTLAGLGFLWSLRLAPSAWLLGGFVVCCGVTLGSRSPLIATTAMQLFRGRAAATIFGCISIGAGAGQALGAWVGGLLHDWSGGYSAVLGFSIVSLLLAMTPFLALRSLRE